MRRRLLVGSWPAGVAVATVALIAVAGSAQDREKEQARPDKAPEVERVVQDQVEAYNKHDIDAFLATYSTDIKLYQFPDKLTGSGPKAIREQYGPMFKDVPDLNAEITKRIVQGDYVIDHEKVTFRGSKMPGVAIYQVKEGKILNVWFLH